MNYSIGEVSKLTGLSPYTLRYYEKEGLLGHIERKSNGLRFFTDCDIELLNVIDCLKATGMSISKIKDYINLCKSGSDTLDTRKQLFMAQREQLIHQIEQLQKHLATANYKIWYYENISTLGDESDPLNCEKMHKLYENLYLNDNKDAKR